MASTTKYTFRGFRHSATPDAVRLQYGVDKEGNPVFYDQDDQVALSADERDRLSNYVILEDSSGDVIDANPAAAIEPAAATSAVDATVTSEATTDAGTAKAKN